MRQHVFLWSSLFILLTYTAGAQDCASIIALSRVVDVIVSDRNTVEQHASRFCDEYRRYRHTGSRASFGASYDFLSFASSRSRLSVDEIASRYCSASSDYAASKDTYRQYTESIAPNSHSSYLQCVEMSERGLRFNVSLASILPTEFSLSVSFLSLTAEEKSADVAVTPSYGVTCEWNDDSELMTTVATGSTTILRCNRNDQTSRSYVRLTRVDGFKGEMVLPWSAYDEDGNAVDALAELQARVADQATHLSTLEEQLALQEEQLAILEDRVQVEKGTVSFSRRAGSGLGGLLNHRVSFSTPFSSTPIVVMAISGFDIIKDTNSRLTVRVTSVDNEGFNFDFVTWAHTKIWSATAIWMAVAE